jgi:hypothetical protein
MESLSMYELSPQAQEVFCAFNQAASGKPDDWHYLPAIAAALRAAADQVAPLGYEDVWTDGRILQYEKRDPVREKLLAIADELEAHD